MVHFLTEQRFLAPMRYSSLFSNHWQLGGQNWQDASSTKNVFILISCIGQVPLPWKHSWK